MSQPAFISAEQERHTPETRALNNYRKRLNQRGMARFEVLGLDGDRELIRWLAKRLAEDGPDSASIRAAVCRTNRGRPAEEGRHSHSAAALASGRCPPRYQAPGNDPPPA